MRIKIVTRNAPTRPLSHPTGDGIAMAASRLADVARANPTAQFFRKLADHSPSPIRWERAGVRAFSFIVIIFLWLFVNVVKRVVQNELDVLPDREPRQRLGIFRVERKVFGRVELNPL